MDIGLHVGCVFHNGLCHVVTKAQQLVKERGELRVIEALECNQRLIWSELKAHDLTSLNDR